METLTYIKQKQIERNRIKPGPLEFTGLLQQTMTAEVEKTQRIGLTSRNKVTELKNFQNVLSFIVRSNWKWTGKLVFIIQQSS